MDWSMEMKKASFTIVLIVLLAAWVYADVAPCPGCARGGGNRAVQILIVSVLGGAVVGLAVIALIAWIAIRRMRKNKAAEKPIDSTPKEPDKAG